MTNANRLKQHALRTLLLEGEEHAKVLKKVKEFNAGEKTPEDKQELTNYLRKQVTNTVKDLVTDDQLSALVDDLSL